MIGCIRCRHDAEGNVIRYCKDCEKRSTKAFIKTWGKMAEDVKVVATHVKGAVLGRR